MVSVGWLQSWPRNTEGCFHWSTHNWKHPPGFFIQGNQTIHLIDYAKTVYFSSYLKTRDCDDSFGMLTPLAMLEMLRRASLGSIGSIQPGSASNLEKSDENISKEAVLFTLRDESRPIIATHCKIYSKLFKRKPRT